MRILCVDLPTALPFGVLWPRIQPPLWVAYLRAYFRPIEGMLVEYIDARAEEGARWLDGSAWRVWGLPILELAERIITKNPDVICIHVGVSTELGLADELVRVLKARMGSRVRILLGGPGIALVPAEFLPDSIKECEVCKTVGFGKSLECDLFVPSPSIDVIPDIKIWARYGDIYRAAKNVYHSGIADRPPAYQIQTSVGCGAQCEFCATRGSLKRRCKGSVQAELKRAWAAGYRTVDFEDDNILAWTDRQVLDAIPYLDIAVELGFAIRFPNAATVRGMLNRHFVEWLERTLKKGIKVKLALPFESASDEILKSVYKPHGRQHCDALLEKLLPLMRQYPDLLVVEIFLQVGFHIIGRDGVLRMEGWRTILQTLLWARKLGRQGFEVNCWFNSPIPGTPLFVPWRRAFPAAPWESLLFSIPSLFYEEAYRQELLRRVKVVNTATRSAAFTPMQHN